jgi:enoyl-CoA hydratase
MTDATAAPALPTYELHDNIAVVTIDDGKANVISTAVLEALEQHTERAVTEARALVFTGRPGTFSAGFNLSEMISSAESMRRLVVRGGSWMLDLYGLGIPTIAACTGHALAGGALILLSCDIRIGADVPSKIGLNEVAIGMGLPKFAVELARERLERRAFTDATMEAKVYDAQEAVEAGYLDRVVPAGDVLDLAMREARRLTELRTGAYALTKTNMRGSLIEAQLAAIEADLATVDMPKIPGR